MIADDFSDIAVRLKQIEQKTESLPDEQIVWLQWDPPLGRTNYEFPPNVEFVQ
jgi:hypothetical protein